MTTPLSSLSASHRAPEKLSQSAKGLPPSSSFPRSSSSPSPLSRRTPSPLPPTLSQQRFSVPRFAEVIVGSSASRLRDIMASFETEPLPYYAVLRGQCPGVYYGRWISFFFVIQRLSGTTPIGKLHAMAVAHPTTRSGACSSARSKQTPCLLLRTCEVM